MRKFKECLNVEMYQYSKTGTDTILTDKLNLNADIDMIYQYIYVDIKLYNFQQNVNLISDRSIKLINSYTFFYT